MFFRPILTRGQTEMLQASEHHHGHHHEHANHVHNHQHSHGDHGHDHRHANTRALRLALFITFGFALVELAGGWWSGSLALLSDAGHMFTDALALLLAVIMARLSVRPASAQHTYGMGRAEVVGAFVNSLFMVAVIIFIVVEAVARMLNPPPVNGEGVMAIATVGLLVNLAAAWVLSQGGHSLNSRAALLHVIGDLFGSVAAIVAGAVVYFTGWLLIDPLLSLLVASLILGSTWRLLRESLLVLMEGVPAHLDYRQIGLRLANIDGVAGVHDLHIWHMSAERIALSAHLAIETPERWPGILLDCQLMLAREFGIDHVTLQPEWPLVSPNGRPLSIEIHVSETPK
jgi:cobalt-zinc-cadmium efflux system protein